jgi:WD40 repeat protein
LNQTLGATNTLSAHTSTIFRIKTNSNGYVATASADNTVKVWDSNNNWSLVQTFSAHTSPVRSLQFIDGSTIISGDSFGKLYRWTIATGATLAQNDVSVRGGIFSMKKFSNISQLVIGAGAYIYFYNVDANNLCTVAMMCNVVSMPAMNGGHTGLVVDLELAQNDTIIISSSVDMTIKIWSIGTYGANLLFTLTGHSSPVYGLKMVSSSIVMSGSDDHKVLLWDINTGSQLQTLASHTSSIYWSVDLLGSNTLITGSMDSTLKVWQLSTGSLIQTIQASCQIEALAVIAGDLTGVYRIFLVLLGDKPCLSYDAKKNFLEILIRYRYSSRNAPKINCF